MKVTVGSSPPSSPATSALVVAALPSVPRTAEVAGPQAARATAPPAARRKLRRVESPRIGFALLHVGGRHASFKTAMAGEDESNVRPTWRADRSRRSARRAQQVAGTPDGPQQARLAVVLELAAQVADVD